jgi:hypothetical protein
MKQLELKARDAGFLNDTDDPEDIQAEFYNADDIPIQTGTSADDAAEKLKEKKQVEVEKGGSLL